MGKADFRLPYLFAKNKAEYMEAIAVYAGLFLIAFLAATLLPAQSEVVFVSLLTLERYPAALLLTVASVGNILGSCLNFAIGRFLANSTWIQRFISPSQRERTEQYYRQYGRWSLLVSWLPIVGDPLTVIAGALRESFLWFIILVTIAKAGRYLVILGIHQAWFT